MKPGGMNAASEWRLALARRVAGAYADNPRVAAIIVSGSVSGGHADRYSDLEMGVMWHEAPPEEERHAAARAMAVDDYRLYLYDPEWEQWADDIFLGRVSPGEPNSGELVELVHQTVEYTERTLADVLEHYDTSDTKQPLMAAIVSAIPLHGESPVESWRARAADYPRGLAVAMVKKHAQIDHFWRAGMYLERGNNLMMLYDLFVQVGKKLVCVLLALNGVYYSGLSTFKWVDRQLSGIHIAPKDAGPRLKHVFQAAPRDGIAEARALVEETYDIIEERMPEVDVERLRLIFRYRRQPWDDLPPSVEVR